jgi:hypothetical protein
MRTHAKLWLAAALLLVAPSFTLAQHASGVSRVSVGAPAAPVSHTVFARTHGASYSARAHVGKSASSSSASSSSPAGSSFAVNTFGSGSDTLSVQQLLDPFPSYGFDFAHLTAIDRDLGMKAFIDPATQVRIAEAEHRLRRIPRTGGGFVLLDGGGAYAIPDNSIADVHADQDAQAPNRQASDNQPNDRETDAQQGQGSQQPIIIVQQPASEAMNATTQEDADQLLDEGEFTLVLRSGQEIEAVAFTHVNDKIIYITSGGGRRTLALSDVDADATVRLNQERGTPLQLPL